MATILASWDTSDNKDLFKKLIRKIHDTTDTKALVEYQNVVKDISSSDEYEREYQIAGLEYAGSVGDGEEILIQEPKVRGIKEWTQVRYGTGFRVSDRMKRFNKWDLVNRWTRSLKKVMKESKDVEIAKMFINASATTYAAGYDTYQLAYDSHTCLDDASTTYDNYLDSALSNSSLESARNYFDYLYNDQAQIFVAQPDTLVVNRSLVVTAEELLGSTLKAHEESNTKNVLSNWLKIFTYHRLTSTTSWFVLAKNHELYDLKVFSAMDPNLVIRDAPDNTMDTVVLSQQYFVYGFGDPRLCFVGDL